MNIREKLAIELSKARPARYEMGDRGWVDAVADGLDVDAIDFNREMAFRDYLRSIARDVEGKATKAGNRLMREFHAAQALPVDWVSFVNEPIALENSQVVDGKTVKVKERVRLCDATPKDFELWARTEDEARRRDYAARGEAVSGALEIASRMRAASAITFMAWAETAPVEGDSEDVA
nr:MAG TPA: hypothetical protein [Caudoviricetes sp.]